MASWIIHLRVADGLLAQFSLDAASFVLGSIAPDCGKQNADGLSYTPPKSVSHFSPDGRSASIDYSNFYDAYIRDEARPLARAFLLGYLAHLITDKLWGATVFEPSYARYGDRFPDKAAFVKAVKHDWYDLDSLYLARHPNFHAYKTLTEMARFEGDYLSFYPPEIIEEKRTAIDAFYKTRVCDLSRTDYFYLTENEADRFVSDAVVHCTEILKSYMGA